MYKYGYHSMAHPFFAVVLDGSIRFQQCHLRRLYPRLDDCAFPQRVQKIGPVQLILGTLANRAVVCVAHGGCCNLQAVHAEQVPEATTLSYLLVGKAEVLIFGAEFIELSNDRDWVHAAMVQVQAAVPLPLDIVDREG